MKVNILYLYAEAMDLYGDKKNLDVLCQRITESGNEYAVSTCEIWDELNPEGFALVYVGHGKARSLAAVSQHFVKYADTVKAHIENGQLWLSTGNSRALFGKEFTTVSSETLPGIGLFDYTGVETNKVFVADLWGKASFDESIRCYGFANRTAWLNHPNGNQHPLFVSATGFGDGETADGTEGTLYKNFIGTWSMGPVLVRNPGLMKEVLRRLGIDPNACDFSLEEQALELVLREMESKKS